MEQSLFTSSPSVRSSRILYTASPFARTSLLHLQEVGSLTAIRSHTSKRENLQSYLVFTVIDGSGALEYEGKHYDLKVGDVVFINCRKSYSHSTGTCGPDGGSLWSLQWVHFYGSSVPSIYAKYCERGGRPVLRLKEMSQISGLLTDLYDMASSDDYIRDMRINELLSSLLTLLMEQSWNPKSGKRLPKLMDVSKIRVYIDEHYAERLSLADVAEHFYISKDYLGRLFKECFGITVNSYILSVRITKAKQLLRFSDKTTEEIGALVGMPDANYFSRMFKKVEGVSPSEYRKLW